MKHQHCACGFIHKERSALISWLTSAFVHKGRFFADFKGLSGIERTKEFDKFRNQSGPACLVAGTEPSAIIPVEIFVEQDVVAPEGVGLELLSSTIDRPPAVLIAQEDAGEPVRDFLGHLEKVHHPA